MKTVVVQAGPFSRDGHATFTWSGRPHELPFAIPGERLRVAFHPSGKYPGIVEVLKPDPSRVEPACGYFGLCSRCQWMMMSYPAQLSWKEKRVREWLGEAGVGLEVPLSVHGLDKPFGVRAQMSYAIRRGRDRQVTFGLPRLGSRWLLDIDRCPAQLEVFNRVMGPLRELLSSEPITVYDEHRDFGKLLRLSLRGDPETGEVLLIFVARRTGISRMIGRKVADVDPEHIVGVLENLTQDPRAQGYGEVTRTVEGRDHYFGRILGRPFKVKGTARAPVNPGMYGRMLERLDAILSDSYDCVVHAGAGVGLICVWLSDRARKIAGIEADGSAFRSAVENAELVGQGNVEFIQGKPEELLPGSEAPDVLVWSSKRGNLSGSLLRWVLEARPRIVLLELGDPRLASGLRSLLEGGYELVSVDVFDPVPHTPRAELLVTLSWPRERRNPGAEG